MKTSLLLMSPMTVYYMLNQLWFFFKMTAKYFTISMKHRARLQVLEVENDYENEQIQYYNCLTGDISSTYYVLET